MLQQKNVKRRKEICFILPKRRKDSLRLRIRFLIFSNLKRNLKSNRLHSLSPFPLLNQKPGSRLGVAPEVSTITNIRHGLSVNQPQMDNDLIDKGPHFSMLATSNATEVLSGENAYLVCSVMNLGKSVVSFLRHSDMNLLSVGKLKYTQDPRYQVFHDEQNNSWTLKVRGRTTAVKGSHVINRPFHSQIKQARREDEGWFECQISSAQPIGHAIYLKVIGKSRALGRTRRISF